MTLESLEFEVPRRTVMFHANTEMPDQSLLGYTGDPNNAVNGSTPGETLLQNAPSGAAFLDRAGAPFDVWDKVVDGVGGTWVLRGSAGGTMQTRMINSISQGSTITVTHGEDTLGRVVTCSKFVPGLLDQTKSEMDYLLSEEGDYIQEDSAEGTDFTGTQVTLHNSGVAGSGPTIWETIGSGHALTDGGKGLVINNELASDSRAAYTEGVTTEAGKKYFFEATGVASVRDICAGFSWNENNTSTNIGRFTSTAALLASCNGSNGYCWRGRYQDSVSNLTAMQYDGTVIVGIDIDDHRVTWWDKDGNQLHTTTAGVTTNSVFTLRGCWCEFSGSYNGTTITVNLGTDMPKNWTPLDLNDGWEWFGPDIIPEYPVAGGTGTYSSFDPTKIDTDIVLSNGNLSAIAGDVQHQWDTAPLTTPIPTGESRYIEVLVDQRYADNVMVGVITKDAVDGLPGARYQATYGCTYSSGGLVYFPEPSVSYDSYDVGDVIGIAFNDVTKEVSFYKNNVLVTTSDMSSFSAQDMYFAVSLALYSGQPKGAVTIRTDPADMSYAAPSGFTAGLIKPTVDYYQMDFRDSAATTGSMVSQTNTVNNWAFESDQTNAVGLNGGGANSTVYDGAHCVSRYNLSTLDNADYVELGVPSGFTGGSYDVYVLGSTYNVGAGIRFRVNEGTITECGSPVGFNGAANGSAAAQWILAGSGVIIADGDTLRFSRSGQGGGQKLAVVRLVAPGSDAPTEPDEGQGGVISPSAGSGKGYYVLTSDVNQLKLETIAQIDSLVITATAPAGTEIKWLASFDGRTSWRRWGGSAWEDHPTGTGDFTDANIAAELSAGFVNFVPSTEPSVDIAFELSSTDSGVTPSVDVLTFTVDENGTYKQVQLGVDVDIVEKSPTTLEVTQVAAETNNLKLCIGT